MAWQQQGLELQVMQGKPAMVDAVVVGIVLNVVGVLLFLGVRVSSAVELA